MASQPTIRYMRRILAQYVVAVLCVLLMSVAAGDDECKGKRLAANEVNALREIALELRKKDWNFLVDPCTVDTSWRSARNLQKQTYVNQLICNCLDGAWHVVNISLKGQDLDGVLPRSVVKLPKLTVIDVSRNYLAGTIPVEWSSMGLQYMSIMANRLSGEIPKSLGNMSSLTYLSIEINQFSGTVPAELGKLVNLQKLSLNANYLTGQLPKDLSNLSNLTEFRISSNNFSGKIPDYFKSWRKLDTLEIQGSGLMGPIPSSISYSTELTELRISDLKGEGSGFPPLQNMGIMKHLMLRNCNISGSIPKYVSYMSQLKSLDLSFNRLEGSIPDGLQNLNLQNMYLTSNFLSGPIPHWIRTRADTDIDLSYNNFDEGSTPSHCNSENLNFFRSSSRDIRSPLAMCLNNFPCSKDQYSLHINCGGGEITIGKTTYAADSEAGGAAKFVPRRAEWGFSSTGHFWYLKPPGNDLAENNSALHVNKTYAGLYTNARTSAISLTYYGRCLGKGNYSVTLHFAEIIFTDDHTFNSLGRRIFDVYIQEKLVLKDFDIKKAANGTDRALKTTFKHVYVVDTVEIRFYFAGKGTTGIPVRGIYGPLISAIDVESEFKPPLDRKKIIRIVVGSVASLVFIIMVASGVCLWRQHVKNLPSKEEVLKGLDLQTGLFTFRQIKAATDNFNVDNKIGEGGFGTVYKGTLLDGSYIAVKKLSAKSSQGNKEFVTEIGMISGLQHPNLVKLYGCCVEGNQLLLVYEYMVNNNLARALFDGSLRLDWLHRQRICVDIAKGLAFLHEESSIKIIHRDIKATNVLLDEDLNAKISDFGLARLYDDEHTHVSTRVAGTIGYMAPEYALWGYLTSKADVYSFGVVALEIVAGRSNVNFVPDENNFCLLDWAFVQQREGNLVEIVDPKLGRDYDKDEALRMIKIALLCTNATPALRPTMSEVVNMLSGAVDVQDSVLIEPDSARRWTAPSSRRQQLQMSIEESDESQSLIDYSNTRSNISA